MKNSESGGGSCNHVCMITRSAPVCSRRGARCNRPNDYAYDRDIAEALRSKVSAYPKLFDGTSLWITVQGRVVFIEGCASGPSVGLELEALARQVPNVQQAIARIHSSRSRHVPYKVLPRE